LTKIHGIKELQDAGSYRSLGHNPHGQITEPGVDRPLKEKQSAMDAFEIILRKYMALHADRTSSNSRS
jgi:hypothetical protein